MTDPQPSRVEWSFAATPTDVAQRRAEANSLVGERVARVRYVTMDDGRFGAVHSVDFGVEIETTTGRVFAVTWDSPGPHEGIGLRETRLVGPVLRPDDEVAVLDVSASSMWAPLVGHRVHAVTLDYRPWSDDGGWWCPAITIMSARGGVVLGLGDVDADGRPVPSADNVLVLASAATSAFPIPSGAQSSCSLDA